MFARERRLAAPGWADQDDEGQLRDGEGHRTNTAICVGGPTRSSSSPTGRKRTVAKTGGDIGGPCLELRARPLEPVILVPKPSRRQRRPLHVVLRVRRRHGDCARTSRLEHHALECAQPRRVEVLDHFHDCCGVESAEPRVAIHERAVHQANAFTLLRRQPVELQARFRQIEYAAGDIHADDLSELVIGEEATQELALAAAEIRTREAPEAFTTSNTASRRRSLRLIVFSIDASCSSIFAATISSSGCSSAVSLAMASRTSPVDAQVARNDGIARRMTIEPALSVPKQLLDLVVPNPVVLLIVENRNQDVQVRQQVAQPACRAERNGEQPARTEGRHASSRDARRLDRVAEGLRTSLAGSPRRLGTEPPRGAPRATTRSRGVRASARSDRPALS